MRVSQLWYDFLSVSLGKMTLNDFKALGYLPEEIKEASSSSIRDKDLLHVIFEHKRDYRLEIARFLIYECGCDPMAKTRWTFVRGVTSPNRSVFLFAFYARLGLDAMSSCLEMGIRWLPSENDKIAHDLNYCNRSHPYFYCDEEPEDPQYYKKDEMSLYLDYGLCITDKNHPHYPLYTHRLETRAVSIALLSTWKTRCPLARLLGRDVLKLIGKLIWSERGTRS